MCNDCFPTGYCYLRIGSKTRRALVDYALRGLLLREPQKRILELERKVHCERDLSNELERKHREGYRCKPFKDGEFNDWAAGH